MKNLKKITYLTIASAATFGVSSCGKYEDGPGFSIRTKKARVNGDWNVKSIGSTVIGSPYTMNMSFDKNGSVILTQTYTYAGSTDTYSYAGTWAFASDKEEFMLNIDGSVQLFEIKRLTNNEMWLDDDITSTDGDIWKLESK
jgi:hypothetical protein